jgi:hypothetical protein
MNDEDKIIVKHTGEEAQIFAMNLLMQLSNEDMYKLKMEFESREIHVEDVCIYFPFIFYFLVC